MSVVSIYENASERINDDLLDKLGDIYINKDIFSIQKEYGKIVDSSVFNMPFYEFSQYMNWTIHKRKKQPAKKLKLAHR